jgi:GWxTD domain-containing protein
MRTLILLSLSLAVMLGSGLAQQHPGGETQLPMYVEPFVLPGPETTTWVVTLNYRIDRELFVPIRNDETMMAGQFRRMGEILVELSDSTGVSFGRRLDRVDRVDNGTPALSTDHQWEQGTASFTVPPGSYRFFLEATDVESQRRQVRKDIILRTPDTRLSSVFISGMSFIEPPGNGLADSVSFDNYGGDVLFGKQRALFVGLRLGEDSSTTIRCRWSFKVLDFNKDKGQIFSDSLPSLPVIRRREITIASSRDCALGRLRTNEASQASFVIVPVSTALLPLRDFDLTIDITTSSGKSTTYSRPLRSVWPEMPFSLKNVDGALDALKFITTGRQLDSLRTGSYEQRRDALERFWADRNRSTTSARNEVMAEYYRRVDYSIKTFGTLRIPDGSRSDRGKVYILYGMASRTERSLNTSGGHTETWFYDRLKKKFVFVDEMRNGTYTLVATAPL